MNTIWQWWLSWWRPHGTKILGFGATALGGLETFLTLKPDEFKLLLGPHFYAAAVLVVAFCITVVGPVIIRRGFTNTGVSGP